jgi:predicted ArsR family transcriptional regulator
LTKADQYFSEIQLKKTDPKRKILYYLKIMGEAGLIDISKMMKISRMGAHKHLSDLQERGLVESNQVNKGVGRPIMIYSLTDNSKTIFPKAYGDLASHALDYLSKKLGNEAVEEVLRTRQHELLDKYYDRLKDLQFDLRVKELAKIRDEEGYMAESKRQRFSDSFVLLEYNCPIIQVAEKHWEACTIETELFEKILDAKIETTHRAAKGDSVCRFDIRKNLDGF